MLIAYLRGLLKPDYPQGVRSIIRENFILQALSRELEANELLTRIRHEGTFISLLTHANANKLLKEQDKMLSLAFDNFRHKIARNNNKLVNMQAIDNLISVYASLKKQGLVGNKLDNTENVN